MKDKKQKQNATNNETTYFYCEIVLRKEKLQSSPELCFQNVYHQNKTTIRKNIRKYEEEDQGKELPQEHKKTLKRYGKHWKEINEE